MLCIFFVCLSVSVVRGVARNAVECMANGGHNIRKHGFRVSLESIICQLQYQPCPSQLANKIKLACPSLLKSHIISNRVFTELIIYIDLTFSTLIYSLLRVISPQCFRRRLCSADDACNGRPRWHPAQFMLFVLHRPSAHFFIFFHFAGGFVVRSVLP